MYLSHPLSFFFGEFTKFVICFLTCFVKNIIIIQVPLTDYGFIGDETEMPVHPFHPHKVGCGVIHRPIISKVNIAQVILPIFFIDITFFCTKTANMRLIFVFSPILERHLSAMSLYFMVCPIFQRGFSMMLGFLICPICKF